MVTVSMQCWTKRDGSDWYILRAPGANSGCTFYATIVTTSNPYFLLFPSFSCSSPSGADEKQTVDLFHNVDRIHYSSVSMLISPSNLKITSLTSKINIIKIETHFRLNIQKNI